MEEQFITINSVPTHLMTWGKEKLENAKEVIVLIPGSPGVPKFYAKFCSTMFDELNESIPICVIGHAGHDEPDAKRSLKIPPLEGNHDLYDLQGQVDHKIEFLKNYIPENAKIHLISHSIGAKISLELLNDENLSKKIHQSYLLFPVIERMLEATNGFWFYKVFNPIHFILRFVYYAFYYLPLFRTVFLYCFVSIFPNLFVGAVIKTSSPTALDKIWFMAVDEMKKVREIDSEVIKKNLHRLKFYYGTNDGWVLENCYNSLIEQFPGIEAELCQRKIDHAFQFNTELSDIMGRMVSEWIEKKRMSK